MAYDAFDLSGKVVLVMYWTTWSRQVNEDLPMLKELYDQYQDRLKALNAVDFQIPAGGRTASCKGRRRKTSVARGTLRSSMSPCPRIRGRSASGFRPRSERQAAVLPASGPPRGRSGRRQTSVRWRSIDRQPRASSA